MALNRWLADNGFVEDVVQAVKTGKLGTVAIEHLQNLRARAVGNEGQRLSKAQLRKVKPEQVRVRGDKLIGLDMSSTSAANTAGFAKGAKDYEADNVF